MAILFSRLARSTYIISYLYRPYNSLSLVLSPDPFAALTLPILSTNSSGSGSKDIKIEPIAK